MSRRFAITQSAFIAVVALFCIQAQSASAFTIPTTATSVRSSTYTSTLPLYAQFGRSGNKRERLNKLAELQEDEIKTDKKFVVAAAGGFVGLTVILLAVGFASGVFDSFMYAQSVKGGY